MLIAASRRMGSPARCHGTHAVSSSHVSRQQALESSVMLIAASKEWYSCYLVQFHLKPKNHWSKKSCQVLAPDGIAHLEDVKALVLLGPAMARANSHLSLLLY